MKHLKTQEFDLRDYLEKKKSFEIKKKKLLYASRMSC